MKYYFPALIICALLSSLFVKAQNPPLWTRNVNIAVDSAPVFPVRIVHDANNNIFVLSTYHNNSMPGPGVNKIYLSKYNQAGALSWNLIYDTGAAANPHGFDMAIDNNGNCYIAGGYTSATSFQPVLLMKVNLAGTVVWVRDSTTAFRNGFFNQVIFKNNRLYVCSSSGIAMFDVNGNEQWSNALPAGNMAVDNAGQTIASVYFSNPANILRLDSSGVINFTDTTIQAFRITTDQNNNFYLLSDQPGYELVKYDSSGNFAWSKNNFPAPPAFGDIGYEVLTDFNNDVIVTGLSDSMYKFSPSGNLIWGKSMNGLDNYLIAAKIENNNMLAIAGTVPGGNGNDMQVATFDLNGNQSWSGHYSSNDSATEFSVDLTIDNSGIYVIENNNQNTTLAKFTLTGVPVDYDLVCVDSVWYDGTNPNYIHVSVFNGNISHLNYPRVQIVSPTGDTISNVFNSLNFFAHLGNTYQTYVDSITVTGIADFSNYTFLISNAFPDTTVAISWCSPTGIAELAENAISVYPNPVHDLLFIVNPVSNHSRAEIFSTIGIRVFEKELPADPVTRIDVSEIAAGLYFIRWTDGKFLRQMKFVKQ